jgi:gamma-glutamyltranspeptidase/glutathione hydrolase
MKMFSAFCSLSAVLSFGAVQAQSTLPMLGVCGTGDHAPFCQAERGVRAEGWPMQSRSEVMASHGMVSTSQPLAAEAGLKILMRGGNAVDAAVATAATLNVVEPMMTGMGGDLFALIYIAKDHRLYALNASGKAPSGATLAHLNALGYHADPRQWGPGSGMPPHGILEVTVPGSVWGWDEVLRRFGRLKFKDVLSSAIDYAEHGFPVSERIASDWRLPSALPLKGCCTESDPDSVRTWYIDGKPPKPGQLFKNPALARTFELLAEQGRDAFYKGKIAAAIVAKSTKLGGTMTLQDLADYAGEWNEPASSNYHGATLNELPPPSQDWAANEMLNILESCVPMWTSGGSLGSLGPVNPAYWHLMVEAKKLAYADLYRFNADPHFAKVPLERLLSKEYALSLCSKVDAAHASTPGPEHAADASGDTVVLATADEEGNMVSWVNSNYAAWGSGITVPEYGFILHNRGGLFSLDPKSPNVIEPHKRPFNTLSAGFVTLNGAPLMTLTLMGGDIQAQGHAQVMVNLFDLGANLQAAGDMARFRHTQVSNVLALESSIYARVGVPLESMGHHVESVDGAGMGGYQAILVMPEAAAGTRVYRAGSDFRKDGEAVGW